MSFEGLHPDVRELLAENEDAPRLSQLSPSDARRQSEQRLAEVGVLDDPKPVGDVSEYRITGPGDDVCVRSYQPTGPGPYPILVWFHGGGWVLGSLDAADPTCRYLSEQAKVVVASVDYRLAPEHPFPEPLKDAYKATEWAASHPQLLDSDGSRVAVGGVSAGGNLAAAVALLARDRNGPELSYQVLGMPITHCSFETSSYTERAEGSDLTRDDVEYFWECYLTSDVDARNPYAAPLCERDLTRLPPALVVTGEYDPLRDDGRRYAERLEAADVDVTHYHYDDAPHGVLGATSLLAGIAPTERAFADVAGTLAETLGT
jgi:acetyl esterase